MQPVAPPLSESERARGRRLAIASNVPGMTFWTAFTEQLPTLALISLGASETLVGLQSGILFALQALQLPALRLVSWFTSARSCWWASSSRSSRACRWSSSDRFSRSSPHRR